VSADVTTRAAVKTIALFTHTHPEQTAAALRETVEIATKHGATVIAPPEEREKHGDDADNDETTNKHTMGEAVALVSEKVAQPVRAVIFDVDGTLIDSVDSHAHAWEDAFREFGHNFPFEKIRSQIGKGGDQLMPVFLSDEEIDAFGHALEARRGAILRERYFPRIAGFPCVRELLERLRQNGVEIVLAS